MAAPPPPPLSRGSCSSVPRNAAAAVVPALLLAAAMAMAAFPGAGAQPSPGYYPSSRFRPIPFNRGYTNKWGPQHQTLSGDHSALTIWLDKTCGAFIFLYIYFYQKRILVFFCFATSACSRVSAAVRTVNCGHGPLASCLWCGSLTCSDLVLVSRC